MKMNKIKDKSMNFKIKSRDTFIKKEKERVASLQSKKTHVVKISKKDHIYKDIASLFGRFKSINNDSLTDSDYFNNHYSSSILNTNKNYMFLKNKPSNRISKKNIQDGYFSDNSPKETLRNNIISQAKKISNNVNFSD